ncbi:hypothetical protein [Flavobacterium sp. WC2509]|uniref:hypothetical protein n=1 Tax=Flavobacterium sp. WC2509 TaxID=3461406 RepID=UPI0040440393
MKNLIYIFVSFVILSCHGQSKTEDKKTNEKHNAELDLTITYPKINLRKIPKTWKSLNTIQKDWIKVDKDKNGYLIYQPCDGITETVKLEGAILTINWRIENSQKFELEKFTRLTENDAFRADAYDVENKIGFEIKARIIDYKNGIVLWEFNGNKWLMTPKENFKSFRIIKNNCETQKKKELDFLPIED